MLCWCCFLVPFFPPVVAPWEPRHKRISTLGPLLVFAHVAQFPTAPVGSFLRHHIRTPPRRRAKRSEKTRTTQPFPLCRHCILIPYWFGFRSWNQLKRRSSFFVSTSYSHSIVALPSLRLSAVTAGGPSPPGWSLVTLHFTDPYAGLDASNAWLENAALAL